MEEGLAFREVGFFEGGLVDDFFGGEEAEVTYLFCSSTQKLCVSFSLTSRPT